MCPSFGVPWARLERAVARLKQLQGPRPSFTGVQPILFLCGLKYLLTYRQATNRRLTHYIDDGLRETVDLALPPLMDAVKSFRVDEPVGRLRFSAANPEFEQVRCAFLVFEHRLTPAINLWLNRGSREANIVRLTFGMGVAARFAPCAHTHVRAMMKRPLRFPPGVLDVLESFRWSAQWSLALNP